MEEDCIFCKIVSGEIPCYKIYEDKDAIVFLDAFPFMKGQTLVIPKKHLAPWLFELDDEIYSRLMLVAKKVAKALDKSLSPVKVGMMVEGLELDHVHIKLFPMGDEGFKGARETLDPKPTDKEFKEMAEKIRMALPSADLGTSAS